MIVHGSSLSPFVRKILVLAHEKGIDVENRPTGIGPKSDEFLAMSPFGKIPAFEDGDYQLSDSSAIAWYLETTQPEPNLIPTEARARGRTIWFDEYADTIVFAAYAPIFFHRVVAPLVGMPSDPAVADKAHAEAVPPVLAYLERVLPDSGFLVEDRITLADISVCSVMVAGGFADAAVDPVHYPKSAAYVAAIAARPSFVKALASATKVLGGR